VSAVVKVCGCRPYDGGVAHTGAGVRNPPRACDIPIELENVRSLKNPGSEQPAIKLALLTHYETFGHGSFERTPLSSVSEAARHATYRRRIVLGCIERTN
jgi:hypothetical protein